MAAVPLKVDALDDAPHDEKMMTAASVFFKAKRKQQPSQVIEAKCRVRTAAQDSFEELLAPGHRLPRRGCA